MSYWLLGNYSCLMSHVKRLWCGKTQDAGTWRTTSYLIYLTDSSAPAAGSRKWETWRWWCETTKTCQPVAKHPPASCSAVLQIQNLIPSAFALFQARALASPQQPFELFLFFRPPSCSHSFLVGSTSSLPPIFPCLPPISSCLPPTPPSFNQFHLIDHEVLAFFLAYVGEQRFGAVHQTACWGYQHEYRQQ